MHTCKAISRKKCVHIQTLPPTSDATSLHSLRAYFQCQEWIQGEKSVLNACGWGYYLSNENKYIPIKTTLPPAPEKLLILIHCNCKTNSDSKRCISGSMESNVQLDVGNVGVLVALIQISRGIRRMKMLTINTIHLSLEYYFSNFFFISNVFMI